MGLLVTAAICIRERKWLPLKTLFWFDFGIDFPAIHMRETDGRGGRALLQAEPGLGWHVTSLLPLYEQCFNKTTM